MAKPTSALMLEAFQEDALEILKEWEGACVRAPTTDKKETFRSLKRCAHNLKGNAGLIGFDQMKDTIHRLESRLNVIEDSGADPKEPSLRLILLEVERFLRVWIQNMVRDANYVPTDLNVLAKIEIWVPGTAVDGVVTSAVSGAADSSAAPPLSVASDSAKLEKSAGAAQPAAGKAGSSGGSSDDSSGRSSDQAPEAEAFISATDTLRVPSQKLDALIQQVGELTLAQAIVSRGRYEDKLDSGSVREAILLCDKLVRNMRMTVLDLRMLPMLGLYSKLERAAMELSIQLQKPLQLLMDGQDVAVDKAVLNRIFDPLLHLLRNAIDHGLELPAARVKKGKPENGTIHISASIVPHGVSISMKDDGQGLDIDRIFKKGIEKGLVTADQRLSQDEIIQLIFEPGFSTAANVTDVSGRGIGLEVVKKELLNLGGQMSIKTVKDQGTEFVFILPTNVSLIDVLVVMNKGHLYCIPTQDVAEILDVQDMKIEISALYPAMTNLRNRVVPIVPLDTFLKVESSGSTVIDTSNCVLVIHYQDQVIGIRVEGVLEQQQVFVRPLKGYLAKLRNMTGSTVLSNGEPSLIINVKEMADVFFEGKRRGGRVGEQSI